MTLQFSKAVKHEAKGRVGIVGPAGGGKSFTGLLLARALAGPAGKIAAIDTEHGSLSKYADRFEFDVIELDTFSPDNFMAALDAAEAAKYAVFMADSLSHFWMGKGGALEFVDLASKRHRDQMGGWKEFRPHEREMVDRMIASPCHIIVTMRTKTDYQEVTDSNGKKKRVKVGLAPVQREGLEYEFDLVGYMDDENNFLVDKSRCPELAGRVLPKPDAKAFDPFVQWLAGAERPIAPAPAAKTPEPTKEQPKSNGSAKSLPEGAVVDHLSAIDAAADLDSLKTAFGAAWTAAKKAADDEARGKFQQAYDAKKAALKGAKAAA
jgi:hypothetical protein